jgi:hypothetical protein
VTAIPRLFDLLLRRRVVVETVRSAEPTIGRALSLVHSAQARAMAARTCRSMTGGSVRSETISNLR